MEGEPWGEGPRQTHSLEEESLSGNTESNREGHIENFLMFTFVVKINPKQPIIVSTFSGAKVQNEYCGRPSQLHNQCCVPFAF